MVCSAPSGHFRWCCIATNNQFCRFKNNFPIVTYPGESFTECWPEAVWCTSTGGNTHIWGFFSESDAIGQHDCRSKCLAFTSLWREFKIFTISSEGTAWDKLWLSTTAVFVKNVLTCKCASFIDTQYEVGKVFKSYATDTQTDISRWINTALITCSNCFDHWRAVEIIGEHFYSKLINFVNKLWGAISNVNLNTCETKEIHVIY